MVNKKQLTQERKQKEVVSEEKIFLSALYDNTKKEIARINAFLNALNHNIKIIKKLLDKVK